MSANVGGRGRSDVDDLIETGNQIGDQSIAGIGRLGAQSWHEKVKGYRRHHQIPCGVMTDGLRSAAAARKDTPKRPFVQGACLAKVGDDVHQTAAFGHVAHEFRGPGIELIVRLLTQPLAVFSRG